MAYRPSALPLGELSPQVTERVLQSVSHDANKRARLALSVFAALSHLSHWEGQELRARYPDPRLSRWESCHRR